MGSLGYRAGGHRSQQGFGCLIRSHEDRGVLVLLDPRIRQKRYGQAFLESLPPYRVTMSITDAELFFEMN
jgi:ATP-dependent DNA helicase DinG